MKLVYVLVFGICGMPMAESLSAQGVAPGERVGTRGTAVPRLMVANPYVSNAADSAPAVGIGTALRERVQDLVGDDYRVVKQSEMNEVLQLYGYPPDAILTPQLAVQFAKNIQTRIVLTSTMVKGEQGGYTVTARLAGINDAAGNVVTAERQPGEPLPRFGRRLADALEPALKAQNDAKECVDEQETRPERAVKAAEKALRKYPDHGLAHFCLFQLAERQKLPRDEVVKRLEASAKGDSLSVEIWRLLIREYRLANDTAKSLRAYQQLLRVAPTVPEVREAAFRFFLGTGNSKMALEVTEAGLKIDPLNTELHDLKANACLSLPTPDFDCAVRALETLYAADSTKTDTAFFLKIVMSSAERRPPDTAQVLKWAVAGSRRFPDNLTLLNRLNLAYVMAGVPDSTIAVTRRILERDTTAVRPALAAVQILAQADRMTETGPFVAFVRRYGGPGQHERLADMFVTVAFRRLRGDSVAGKARDLAGAIELARIVIEMANAGSQNAFRGHYILGLGLFLQATGLDADAERQKSCDMVKQEQRLLAESKEALVKLQPAAGDLATQAQRYLKYIEDFTPRIGTMLNEYCK